MTALIRTASGRFTIDDAIDIEALCEMSDEEIADRVIPMQDTLDELGIILLNDKRVTAFCNGNSSYISNCRITSDTHFKNIYRVYSNGTFLGIGAVGDEGLIPVKVLYHQ